jgi:type II secretory pathway component HofQ
MPVMSESESARPRFRLKTLLFVVAIIGLGAGLLLQNARLAQQHARIKQLEAIIQPGRGRHISINVNDEPLRGVLSRLSHQSGHKIAAVDDATGNLPVTIELFWVEWETVLDVLSARYKLVIHRGNLARTGTIWVARPPLVEYEFDKTGLREVLQRIADIGGANLVIGPEVPEDELVTFKLSRVPWRTVLEVIARVYGFSLIEDKFGVLSVVPAAPAAKTPKQPKTGGSPKPPQPGKAAGEEPAIPR